MFDKMLQAYQYDNDDKAALGYDDGNKGFAQGKGAMYWHGTYAIPAIRSYNEEINLGTFATPADSAQDTKVVTGVDVALTMGAGKVDVQGLEVPALVVVGEGTGAGRIPGPFGRRARGCSRPTPPAAGRGDAGAAG